MTEQDDAGSEWSTWCTGRVYVRETGSATKANRLEMESPEQNKGCILMLYKYLSDEIVCYKEIVIHMSLYLPPP